jgi:hypothetical protein
MRIKNKTPGLRIVGGTAYAPVGAETSSLSEPVFRRPEPPRDRATPLTETSENARLREQRKQAWRMAETATRYWRVRMHFDHAVYMAQMMEIPEAAYHRVVDSKGLRLAERWREALNSFSLLRLISGRWLWKKAVLASGDLKYTGVKPERIERAIADDLAFLAAHPTRRNNGEVMARRREFKEAMRRRIRDVAASRDLSGEEIKPALTLKHQEIACFSEQHDVNIEWLLEGTGRIFKKDGGGVA